MAHRGISGVASWVTNVCVTIRNLLFDLKKTQHEPQQISSTFTVIVYKHSQKVRKGQPVAQIGHRSQATTSERCHDSDLSPA